MIRFRSRPPLRAPLAASLALLACLPAAVGTSTASGATTAAPVESGAVNLYVSASGNDGASGGSASPFRTIARAQRAARTASASGNGVHVWIAGGTHYLDATLAFDNADSGADGHGVTYSGYPGQTALLSGGRRVTNSWTDAGDGIKKASLGAGLDVDELFINGARQVLARYPNLDPSIAVLGGYTSMATLNQRSATWAQPSTGDVRALHSGHWGGNSFTVTGRSNGALTLAWVGDNNRGSGKDDNRVLVENIREELDANGEWFYDRITGTLYVEPAPGLDLDTATVETGELTELIRVQGASAADPVHDLRFENLTLSRVHRSLFASGTYEKLQLGDWAVARRGAVHLKNTERITVAGSTFDHVGGNGVFVDGYNDRATITGNTFTGSGASDVQVVGAADAVRNHSTWSAMVNPPTDATPGPKSENYPRDITVSLNSMSDMGRFEKQSAGVNISMAARVTVSHNTVHGSPRSCINVNDGTWGGHLIEFNDVFDCVKETSDHGPINAWGRDRFWPIAGPSLNPSAESDAYQRSIAKLDVVEPIVIANNRIHHTSEWAIDLDDGSSNYVLKNNLLLNAGIKLRDGFFRTVENNILINGRIYEQISHRNNGDAIHRNITLASAPYAIHSSSDPALARYTADQNLFWNNGSAVTFDAKWPQNDLDAHSRTADPMFVGGSPWAVPAMRDYTVRTGSPALALGFLNFPMDRFGTGRPGEATPGAVQLSGGAPSGPSIKGQREEFLGAVVTGVNGMSDQSATGLPDQDGVYLVGVPTTSAAYGAGLRAGDVIRGIGATRVSERNSFWTAYNALAPGASVALDTWRGQQAGPRVVVTKPLGAGQRYNDTSGFTYAGSGWTWYYSGIGGEGSLMEDLMGSRTVGDAASYTFNGTGVDILGPKYSDQGLVEFFVDGVSRGTVDTRSSTRLKQQVIFSVRDLASGPHTVKAVMKSGQYFLIDGARVYSPASVTLNNEDPAITYGGAWSLSAERALGDLGDDVRYTRTNGDAATFTFTGTGVHLISERNSDQGLVEIYLDGALRTTVDTTGSKRLAQQVVFAVSDLPAGRHALMVRKKSGTFMLLDGVRVRS